MLLSCVVIVAGWIGLVMLLMLLFPLRYDVRLQYSTTTTSDQLSTDSLTASWLVGH